MKHFLSGSFLFCFLFSVFTHAHSATEKEKECTALADFAFTQAQMRAKGHSEALLLQVIKDALERDTKNLRVEENIAYHQRLFDTGSLIIAYIYTMELSPAKAKKLVGLKCNAGDFNVY